MAASESLPRIAPSILAADFSRLAEEIQRVENGGADLLHLAVMDGHFVPNLTFGPMLVRAMDRITKLPLSTHLMMSDPAPFLKEFVAAGSDSVIVHVEIDSDVRSALKEIRDLGAGAGITLNPGTPFQAVEPFLEEIDLLLVMSVHPGFGGQGFIPEVLSKATRAAELKKERGLKYEIHIDGGIDTTTALPAIRAGAEVLIVGSAVFKAPDPGAMVGELRRVAEKALAS